jgi:hypothetical protein
MRMIPKPRREDFPSLEAFELAMDQYDSAIEWRDQQVKDDKMCAFGTPTGDDLFRSNPPAKDPDA